MKQGIFIIAHLKGKVIFPEGEFLAILGVELRIPPPVLADKFILAHQQRLQFVSLVVPDYHVTFKLNINYENYITTACT